MRGDDDKIAAHAMSTPLISRLRGESFIPGVHYAKQAEQWMLEAATQLEQLARDVIAMAQAGSMPDTYWHSDSRISRACDVLGISPDEARDMEFDDD
jgi:hypothetical protein